MAKGQASKYSPSAISGGGGFGASGALSGVSGTTWLSGPWMIEEQNLTINYTRVPNGIAHPYDNTLTLADTSTVSVIVGTTLVCHVVASYSRVKSYTFFDSSGFQQPQSFGVNAASADHLGTTYGTIIAGSSLGPAGNIQTSTPWINRRYWNDAVDSVVSQEVDGFTFAVSRFTGASSVPYVAFEDPGSYMGDYETFFIAPGRKHTHKAVWLPSGFGDNFSYDRTPLLNKVGPYDTTQDTPQDLTNLVTLVANLVKNTQLRPSSVKVKEQEHPFVSAADKIGMALYEPYRHVF